MLGNSSHPPLPNALRYIYNTYCFRGQIRVPWFGGTGDLGLNLGFKVQMA